MGFRKVTYVTASCDHCGPDWWRRLPEVEMPPHFDDQALGRKQLVTEYGWRIEKRIDGRHRMYCPNCRNKSDCELSGCEVPSTPEGRIAVCVRCGTPHRRNQPAGRHPEKLNDPLPTWLQDLEVQLFGTPGQRRTADS